MSTVPKPAYGGAAPLAPSPPRRGHRRSATVTRRRVATHRHALDAALAGGSDRSGRPELAMRAAQLERTRHRRSLAWTLRGFVDEACGPRPPALATAIVISHAQIRAHADSVLALAARLDSPQPASAAGIAIAQRLVTDALASPLYVSGNPERLRALARAAITKMDGDEAM
jgi:hypothetical protein